MKFLFAMLALEALATSAATQKTLHMNFEKHKGSRSSSRLHKRAKMISESLSNEKILYFANVSVGTPPQSISLQLDTASASFCQESDDPCYGGTFDQTASSTYDPMASPVFNITYVDGTGSNGNFFIDNLRIADTDIKGQQMGLATDTTIGTGIMGIGYTADESVCSTTAQCETYPSVIDQMVNQSAINRKVYSLWLEDLESNTGTILFGGVDSSKYLPPLVALPIQNDVQSSAMSSFTVAWTDLYLDTPNGRVNGLWSGGARPAILDSGTSLVYLPSQLANAMYNQFGAVYDSDVGGMVADCSLTKSTALFSFQFGGSNGPVIQVPTSEFLLPVQLQNGDVYTRDGVEICEVGIQTADDPSDPILLGDTFLRSAYVVYDLDNNIIALAQSDFSPGNSNVHEIPAGTAAIPGVSSTASGASVTASQTGRVTAAATAANNAYAAVSSVTGTPLTMYTAVNTNAPSNVAGARASSKTGGGAAASPSEGAAAGLMRPLLTSAESYLMFILTAAATLFGSSMLVL